MSTTKGSADIEDRIRTAYRGLAGRPGEFVRLAALREDVGALRRDLDPVLIDMYRRQEINLIPRSNQRALTGADREASLRCGGEDKHLISIE